jgi:quinol monooxygenase YgiN
MVRLTISLHAASARAAQGVLDTLRYLAAGTRLEPGCQECQAWIDPDGAVHYLEGWTSEPEMRRRVRSDGFTSLLSVLECAEEPPHVQFDFVTTTRGLDFVEEVRTGA